MAIAAHDAAGRVVPDVARELGEKAFRLVPSGDLGSDVWAEAARARMGRSRQRTHGIE